MVHELKDQSTTKYIVCHNGVDVYHFITLDIGQDVASGQPYMSVFDTESEMIEAFGDKMPNG